MIFIVNNTNEICGVHQFGRKLHWIASRYEGFPASCHVTVDSIQDFYKEVSPGEADVILFNWHTATQPWLTSSIVRELKDRYGCKVGIIPHNKRFSDLSEFDFVLYDDDLFEPAGKEFKLSRVILPFDKKYDVPDNVVGFFGFPFPHKNLLGLAAQASQEWEAVTLRLHCAKHPCDDGYYLRTILKQIEKDYKNVTVELETQFLEDYIDVVDWLAHNTINVFPYLDSPEGIGQSATVDFAMAARRPISVSASNMFPHIQEESIRFPHQKLRDIIDRGLTPLEPYYSKWSLDNYRQNWLKCLEYLNYRS